MALDTEVEIPPKEPTRESPGVPKESQATALTRMPSQEAIGVLQLEDDSLQVPSSLLTPNRREALANFLEEEYRMAELERGDFVQNIIRWKEAYDAPPAEGPKHWPIYNSSNITIPVIKEIVNTLASQVVQSTQTARPRWVTQGLSPEWEPFVDEVERFLDLAADRDIGLDEATIPWILEACKLGTSIVEVGHMVDRRKLYMYTADGRKVFPTSRTFRDGPFIKHFPLQDFWIRMHERDIQRARWVGKRLWFPEWLLKEREKQGRFFNIDKVLEFGRQNQDEVRDTEDDLQGTSSVNLNMWAIFETWVSFDLRGDGNLVELRVFFHRDSKTIVSCQFHPYWHGRRPFIKLIFFPKENRFYGMGLAEMLEDLQIAITDKNNKRADNEAMANLKMILKRKMVKDLQPGHPLYTGKVIEVNDIWNDVREFTMSEIYPSTVNEEQILRNYADRLAGYSDAISGAASPVTRTTASAQLALLQEQAKRIDLTVRNVRSGMNEIGKLCIELYFQFGTNGKAIAWLGEKAGIRVEGLFRLPRGVHELGLALTVSTPTSLQNRQTKRENSIALFNLLIQMHERLLPFVQYLAPEGMGEVAKSMAHGATRFLEDVLETFEVTDPDDLLAGLQVLEKVLPSPEDLGGMEAYERAAEVDQISAEFRRLEALLREAEESRTRGNGMAGRGERARAVAPPEGVRGGPPAGFPVGG